MDTTGDPEFDKLLDECVINLPDPPEPEPVDYSTFTLAGLLDDLVSKAKQYGLSDGFDVSEEEVEAARARVDERLKQAGLL
jgi:hypothetical protein